jgi:hypothetical protein
MGADRAALICTLIRTARLNDIDLMFNGRSHTKFPTVPRSVEQACRVGALCPDQHRRD